MMFNIICSYVYRRGISCLYFFFFLMMRHPPRSPLFPHTPLSRSPRLDRAARPEREAFALQVLHGANGRMRLRDGDCLMPQLLELTIVVSIPLGPSVRASTSYKRSEEHTSELQSQSNLVCRLLLEK